MRNRFHGQYKTTCEEFYLSTAFLIINQLDALISQIYFGRKLYMFQTVPLSIIRSFSPYTLYTVHRTRMGLAGQPDPAHKLSTNLYYIYHCCMYSEKLLMMGRGTV